MTHSTRDFVFDDFVHIGFGLGAVALGRAEFEGQFGVVLMATKHSHEPGSNIAPTDELQDGGIVLWFPTEAQADSVREALSFKK